MNLKWSTFLDKVYGCWIGKCVSGTIGAPYEGYKGILNVQYSSELIKDMLPNDDLDLQVLWLEVLEKKGANFTSEDLADIFAEKCPYSPGEYAIFKKNYALGIHPPLSGKYNNNYYLEGMGCPIRSEIWACIAPGDAALAASYSAMDGCLDHAGESITAEQYLAALESLAFFWENDIRSLMEEALHYIPCGGRFARLIHDIIDWSANTSDWRIVYGLLLRNYGHSDCTNLYQNMGIIGLALLLGSGDLISTTMLALNCGFDTDCTCATVGAVLGILTGGDALMQKHHFPEQTYKLGVLTERRSDRVYDLAVDTAYAALSFAALNKVVNFTDLPDDISHAPAFIAQDPLRVSVSYEKEEPVISLGETRQIVLELQAEEEIRGTLDVTGPENFTIQLSSVVFHAGPTPEKIIVRISANADAPVLWNKNLFQIRFFLSDGRAQSASFGLAGAQLWKVYGPFWENVTEVAAPGACESYYSGLGGKTPDESLTNIRQFHLNMKAKWEAKYMEPYLLQRAVLPKVLQRDPAYLGFPVSIYADRFTMEDVMDFYGPCIIYMVRDIYAPEDCTLCLQIGHSDKFSLWQDAELLAECDGTDNWTPENLHRLNIRLKKGSNRFVLKMARTNGKSDFSLIFTEGGACTTMDTSLGSHSF